jgi:hypothetical protein
MGVKEIYASIRRDFETLRKKSLENGKQWIVDLEPVFFGLISGFFVLYFLYFLDAYGIQKGLSYSGHSHLFRSICYGVFTFGYISIFEIWIKPKWGILKLRHMLLWYGALVFLGSQFIFVLFNFFWNWQEWNLEAYALILREFPLMMLLPISFYLSLKSLSKSKRPEREYLLFQSKNGKDQLKVQLQDFLYANSSDNYITIFYLSDNRSREHLIRKPLKVLEEELKTHLEIIRPHRSYLVNRLNIQAVKQAKGKVYIEVNGLNVSVSKQFHKDFLD